MTYGPSRFRLSRRGLVAGLGASAIVSPSASAQRRRNREQTLSYPPPETALDRDLGLSPTPACAAGDAEATERQTEGPFYTPNTPLRDDLTAGVEGPLLVVVGRVLTPDCRPLAGAVLDFWQADAEGEYDNEGFRPARPSVHGRLGRVPAHDDPPSRLRIGPRLPRAAHPRQGPGPRNRAADDPALLPRRRQRGRPDLSRRFADDTVARGRRSSRAFRLRARLTHSTLHGSTRDFAHSQIDRSPQLSVARGILFDARCDAAS